MKHQSVQDFLNSIKDIKRKEDAHELCRLIEDITGEKPYLYGSSIVGFGTYHYKYESGREGDTIVVGFAPRKDSLVLYGVIYYDKGTDLLDKLGKVKTGKGCLYIKRLSDIDIEVLKTMISTAYKLKKK